MLFLSSICYASVRVFFIDALWSPTGKGLIFWFSFVISICEVVIFTLVSWVGCGA